MRAAMLSNAVVFVEQTCWPDYAPFFAKNLPSLDSEVVYAVNLGDKLNCELMELYPGRAFFRYAGGQLLPLDRGKSSCSRSV
ncbi:MAG: hypothetical protein M3O34_10580 [Chloroflexota bacterium]|nr:hypothetical protein [Chloroflexota bacterium]